MARLILFRCTTTGMNVQHGLADTSADAETHVPVKCPACTRIHLISTSTGKPLGEK